MEEELDDAVYYDAKMKVVVDKADAKYYEILTVTDSGSVVAKLFEIPPPGPDPFADI